MKSNLNRENFKIWIKSSKPEEVNRMIKIAVLFGECMKKDDNEKMKTSYDELHRLIVQAEEKCGLPLVESPDENYYRAFIIVSDWANKALVVFNEKKNQTYKSYFGCVQDANTWLNKNSVDVTSMELETGTGLGLFANHTIIKRITLIYRKNENTKYFYNILEQEELGLFKKMDTNKMAEKWKQEHPALEIICQKYFSNARGNAASLAIGFGNYAENFKVVTLYRGIK